MDRARGCCAVQPQRTCHSQPLSVKISSHRESSRGAQKHDTAQAGQHAQRMPTEELGLLKGQASQLHQSSQGLVRTAQKSLDPLDSPRWAGGRSCPDGRGFQQGTARPQRSHKGRRFCPEASSSRRVSRGRSLRLWIRRLGKSVSTSQTGLRTGQKRRSLCSRTRIREDSTDHASYMQAIPGLLQYPLYVPYVTSSPTGFVI